MSGPRTQRRHQIHRSTQSGTVPGHRLGSSGPSWTSCIRRRITRSRGGRTTRGAPDSVGCKERFGGALTTASLRSESDQLARNQRSR